MIHNASVYIVIGALEHTQLFCGNLLAVMQYFIIICKYRYIMCNEAVCRLWPTHLIYPPVKTAQKTITA